MIAKSHSFDLTTWLIWPGVQIAIWHITWAYSPTKGSQRSASPQMWLPKPWSKLDQSWNRSVSGMYLISLAQCCLGYWLDHIRTTWIWSLVVTQPIAGGPEAVGFASVSPVEAVVRKRLTFGQCTHYNLLLSKTHRSFPLDIYSTQYLLIISEFCRSRNRSASPVSAD
jgi:hypothetical protein